MDFVDIILIITAVVGLLLMAVTVARLRADDERPEQDAYLEAGNSIKAINTSIDEAEKAVDELNKFAESVMKDIDAKHQELLFVYNLIEEKKGDISHTYGRPAGSLQSKEKPAAARAANERAKRTQSAAQKPAEPQPERMQPRRDIHPRSKEIMEMYDQGVPIPEIARTLDMGQGEVKLIVELTKAR